MKNKVAINLGHCKYTPAQKSYDCLFCVFGQNASNFPKIKYFIKYIMTQFDIDYKHGKESEIISLPDLRKLFGSDLILDKEMFAHFDYFKDDIMCELKTRDDIIFKNNQFHYTTRNGKKMILDSIYFDAVKMRFAFQHNKKRKDKKRFFIIWKCNGLIFIGK
jgi:hypothetical protein